MGHNTCCVVKCKNNGKNSSCKFYTFPTSPWKLEQRNGWIAAVNRKNADGSPWYPKRHDTICSAHFIGGKKAEEEGSPSYIPTIFSSKYWCIKMKARAEYDLPMDVDRQCSQLEDPLDVKQEPDDFETDIKKEAQEENDVSTDNDLQCLHSDIKIERDGVETVAKESTSEAENIIQGQNQGETNRESDVALPSSLSTDNIRPKIVNLVVSRTIILNDIKIGNIKKRAETESLLAIKAKNIMKNEKVLTFHTNAQTGGKPYMCNTCKKCFSSIHKLKLHIRTHSGIKTYMCHVCKTYFSHKFALDRHYRTHTDDKPYKCDDCKEGFYEKRCLQYHIRTQACGKPYKCQVCDNRFAYKIALISHMHSHDDVKSYVCDICEKRYTLKYTMERHRRTHTDNKPYK